MRSYRFSLVVIILLCCGFTQAQYKQTMVNKTRILFNHEQLVPFRRLDDVKLAVVTTDSTKYQPFIKQLARYIDFVTVDLSRYDEQTKFFNTIIVAGEPQELSIEMLAMIKQSIVNRKSVVLCTFLENEDKMQQYGLQFAGAATELIYIGSDRAAQQKLAMSLFGGLGVTEGDSANRTDQTRIQYALYNEQGIDIMGVAEKVDAIAAEAIQEKAAPGMVVMALKDGQVVFEKAYGYHTYQNVRRTTVSDIFDLASVSKIVGTTPVVMELYEQDIIHLDSTMGYYLWQAKNSNKSAISLRTVMLHEAGFTPYIPFYKDLKEGDLQRTLSPTHAVQVADSVYLRNNYYQEIMWPQMLQSAVKPIGNYTYSDISMYVMKEVAEYETGIPMDEYVQQHVFRPIGMKTAGYNPRKRFAKEQIVPTEEDTSFRKVLLEGFVHDQGAAMAGGVAGHAGLFASANDLAIYGQMLLNRGKYGGVYYFKPTTVDLFTSRQSLTSRRGLGFDRYDANSTSGYPSQLANESVYGHTGYTGTCIWIDPKNQFVYIFLSNRVHPQVSAKLIDLNIRGRIQDVFYEGFENHK